MKVVLVDNGSLEAAAHEGLRSAAASIGADAGVPVEAVSWKHSDRIPPAGLPARRTAHTLAPWVRSQVAIGEREFVFVPFFISAQGAIGSSLRADLARLQKETGGFDYSCSPTDCRQGTPCRAIVADRVRESRPPSACARPSVIVVDHGGPSPEFRRGPQPASPTPCARPSWAGTVGCPCRGVHGIARTGVGSNSTGRSLPRRWPRWLRRRRRRDRAPLPRAGPPCRPGRRPRADRAGLARRPALPLHPACRDTPAGNRIPFRRAREGAGRGSTFMSDTAPGATKPLHKNEQLKAESHFLRGHILRDLEDPTSGTITEDSAQLTKFHGIYPQDDRDLRTQRRKEGKEKAYIFMARVRVPGGVCTPAQWLALDAIAEKYGNSTLKITNRQAIQLHGVIKSGLRAAIHEVNESLLDTLAACGDVNRNVMCNPNPHLSPLHAEVLGIAKATADHLLPKTRAYHELWVDDTLVAGGAPVEDEEPMYGRTYLPRKFKIGFAIPPSNDVDVYANDLGFIADHRRARKAHRLQRDGRRRHGDVAQPDRDLPEARRRARFLQARPGRRGRREDRHGAARLRRPHGQEARAVQVHGRRPRARLWIRNGRSSAGLGWGWGRPEEVRVHGHGRALRLDRRPERRLPLHPLHRERSR